MGNNFETNKKYNSENYVHLTLNLDKRCYSQGEYIKGTLFLIGKQGLIQTQLIDPSAKATLSEIQHYIYQEETQGSDEGNREMVEEEENIIFENRLCFPEYTGANLVSGVQIPFSIQVTNCYPTCIFSSRDYVKHFFAIEFPSIQAKRTEIIVVKNNQSFTIENRLYESPAIRTLEMEKHKFFFSKGKFAAVLKLAKNIFAYNENIPFELNIDCTQLELKIKSIEVNLRRCERKNYKNNKDKVRNCSYKTIMPKVINLVKGQPKYLIQDCIQFPLLASELNPMALYKELDEKRSEIKLEKMHLSPSSKGGLLSVDYSLSVKLNFSTKLSTDEKITIPLYFYVPFDINGQNRNLNNVGLSQPYNGGNQYQQIPNSNIGIGLSQPYNGGNQYQQGINSNIGLSQPYNGGNQFQQNQNKGTGLSQPYNGGNQYQYNNNYQNYYSPNYAKNNVCNNNNNNQQNYNRINQQPLQGNKDLYYQKNKLNNNLNQQKKININNNYQNVNIPQNIYKDNVRVNQLNNNVYNNYKIPNVNNNLNNKYPDNVRIQPTNNINNRAMNNQLMYNQNIYKQYNNKPY